LRDAPEAFSATLEATLARTDEQWEKSLYERVQFVVHAGAELVGTAGGVIGTGDGAAELVSMWVAPLWRGRGVGPQLIEAVTDWAVSEGFREIQLWVVEGNVAAEKVYAKAGFQRTGRRQPVRPGEPGMEFEMARRP
jgi:RimJ/RimL family protein N-acetyltransferase